MKCFMCEERILKGTTAYTVNMDSFTVDIEKTTGTAVICEDCIDDFISEYSVSFAEWFLNRYCIDFDDYIEINCFALSKSIQVKDLYDWLDDHKTLWRNLFIERVGNKFDKEK